MIDDPLYEGKFLIKHLQFYYHESKQFIPISTMAFSQVDYKVLAERLAKKLEDQGTRRLNFILITEHSPALISVA